MTDIVDKLGQVHKLVPVSVDKQDSCTQCSLYDAKFDMCGIEHLNNMDCFASTGDPYRPVYAYKIDGNTLLVG